MNTNIALNKLVRQDVDVYSVNYVEIISSSGVGETCVISRAYERCSKITQRHER